MSVKINNIQVTNVPSLIVGTLQTSDNSTKSASTAFINNLINSLNLVMSSAVSITITAVKTFNNLVIPSGISSSVNIGTIDASVVNINGASGTFSVLGIVQPSNSVWNSPLVSTSSLYTKLQLGVNTASNEGSLITYSNAFSSGCIPIVIGSCNNNTPSNQIIYNSTSTGFYAKSPGTTKNISWIAIGY